MSETAVQVAVRVRPFNGREKAMNAMRCIDMDSNTTWVHEEDGYTFSPFVVFFLFFFSLFFLSQLKMRMSISVSKKFNFDLFLLVPL